MCKKRFLGLLAAAVMLLSTSCQNDDLSSSSSGQQVQVKFNIQCEKEVGSRAASRAISDGSQIDQLIYEVYDETGTTRLGVFNGNSQQTESNVNDLTTGHTVNITLAKGQTYQVLFWAQDASCTAYTTNDLRHVSISYENASNNDESRDAFFGKAEITVLGDANETVHLKRPFAQINVGVTQEDWTYAVNSGVNIQQSKAVIRQAATQLDLLTGAVSAPTDVTYDFAVIPTEDLKVTIDGTEKTYKYLSMGYILPYDVTTGSAQALLTSLSFSFHPTSGNDIVLSEGLNNIPVQRNYRTNIVGRLLTGMIDFNVIIDNEYNGNFYPLQVADITAANAALANGRRNVEIMTITTDDIVYLPSTTDNISVTLPSTSNTVTFASADAATSSPANLEINTDGTVNGLNINMPNSTVNVTGNYTNVTSTTSQNTLIISQESSISNKLTVNKGNVKIFGSVAAIEKAQSYSDRISFHITTIDQFKELPMIVNENVKTGELGKLWDTIDEVALATDIDLEGISWTPVGTVLAYPSLTMNKDFDGCNHTVSNLTTSDNTPIHATAALFGSTIKSIKNLKMKNVQVTSSHYAGAICGYISNGNPTIDNCHVEDATIVSIPETSGATYDNGDKVGGIIGLANSTQSISNCSVKNVTIQGFRDLGGIAGLAGANVNVNNNEVTNLTIVQDNTRLYEDKDINTFAGIVGRINDGPVLANNTASIASLKVIACQKPNNLKAALELDAKNIEVELSGEVTFDVSDTNHKLGGLHTDNIVLKGKENTNASWKLSTTYRSYISTNNNSQLTIKDLAVVSEGNSVYTWDAYDVVFKCGINMENIRFNKAVALANAGKTSTLKQVTIEEKNSPADAFALWIVAGGNVTIDGLLIDAVSTTGKKNRAIAIKDQYVENPQLTILKITNATIKSDKKAAILVTSTAGANISLANIDLSGVADDTTNAVWVDEDRKDYYDKVTVVGGTKKQE